MTNTAPRSLRHTTVAVMAAALLGAATLMAVSPGHASAAYGVSGARDFCLHYSYGQNGGLYHFSGSDSNLDNDLFEGWPRLPVGGHAESVWNNGRATTSGLDDVVVFAQRNWNGDAGCVRLGRKGDLAGGLVNNVHSYRWVTPATCNRYRSALAPRR